MFESVQSNLRTVNVGTAAEFLMNRGYATYIQIVVYHSSTSQQF